MNEITQREYLTEVRSIAEQIVAETREADEGREWALDRAHEVVDGHEWIIYTWANPYVLIHCGSGSEDALFDVESPVTTESYSDIMMRMAFYALLQDVQIDLDGMLEEAGIE